MCVCLYIYECIITFPGRAEMREHGRTMELVLEDWWSPSCSARNAQMSPHTQRPVQIGGTLFGWSLRTIKIVLVGKRLLWVILYVVRTWCEYLRAPRGFACDYIILGGKGVWVGRGGWLAADDWAGFKRVGFSSRETFIWIMMCVDVISLAGCTAFRKCAELWLI